MNLLIIVLAGVTASDSGNTFAPMINDVATDLEDPPTFVKAECGPLPESFKDTIKQCYPDLKTLNLDKDKKTVFEKALSLAEAQPRWTVNYHDGGTGIIEGVAVTFLFRFRDDFIIRIKENKEGGCSVDMRSKSRLGKGDLGANANRIRDYFEALRSAF